MTADIRLGVNIDHIATLRNARGEGQPDIWRGAMTAVRAGADSITVHLREDRRHIRDADVALLCASLPVPLNLEMAATGAMLNIACRLKPAWVCLVPEGRLELTTEGGLDAAALEAEITPFCRTLQAHGVRVSLFVDADLKQLDAAARIGADAVELHTGGYCKAQSASLYQELERGAAHAHSLNLRVHAGHGIDYEAAAVLSRLPHLEELNIGHFLIAEAVFVGLETAIQRMRQAMRRG